MSAGFKIQISNYQLQVINFHPRNRRRLIHHGSLCRMTEYEIIVNCTDESLQHIEFTTVKDVIETTIWLQESKVDEMSFKDGSEYAADNVKAHEIMVIENSNNNGIAEITLAKFMDSESNSKEGENEIADETKSGNGDVITENVNDVEMSDMSFHGNDDVDDTENDGDISNYFDVSEEVVESNWIHDGSLATTGEIKEQNNYERVKDEDDLLSTKYKGDNKSLNAEYYEDNEHKNEKLADEKQSKLKEEGDDGENFFIPNGTKNVPSLSSSCSKSMHSLLQIQKHHNHKDTYIHPQYKDYEKITKKYFKFIQRYHIADTLPTYFKGKLQMQLRAAGVNHLTLGLFGAPGAGKSSFLNSLYAAMNGHYVEYSAERKIRDTAINNLVNKITKKSATNQRIELRLTETITVLDNRATDFSKNSMREIIKQCEGFRENGSLVPDNWDIGFKQRLKDFFEDCSKLKVFRNRVQTPIVVNSLGDGDFDVVKYKLLVSTIIKTCGFSPIIILTHADTVTDKNRIMERTRNFEELNCPRVYVVSNYTHKTQEYFKDTDAMLIEILFNCCLVGDQEMQYLMKTLNSSCCFN